MMMKYLLEAIVDWRLEMLALYLHCIIWKPKTRQLREESVLEYWFLPSKGALMLSLELETEILSARNFCKLNDFFWDPPGPGRKNWKSIKLNIIKEWKVEGSWLVARLQNQNIVSLALLLEQSKVNKLLADLSFLESEAATEVCLGYGWTSQLRSETDQCTMCVLRLRWNTDIAVAVDMFRCSQTWLQVTDCILRVCH